MQADIPSKRLNLKYNQELSQVKTGKSDEIWPFGKPDNQNALHKNNPKKVIVVNSFCNEDNDGKNSGNWRLWFYWQQFHQTHLGCGKKCRSDQF